jgi:hypothetical protein
MRIEGFCDEDGTLQFCKGYKASDFLTAYRPFFNDNFLDLVIHKAFSSNFTKTIVNNDNSEKEQAKNIFKMFFNGQVDSEIYELIYK